MLFALFFRLLWWGIAFIAYHNNVSFVVHLLRHFLLIIMSMQKLFLGNNILKLFSKLMKYEFMNTIWLKIWIWVQVMKQILISEFIKTIFLLNIVHIKPRKWFSLTFDSLLEFVLQTIKSDRCLFWSISSGNKCVLILHGFFILRSLITCTYYHLNVIWAFIIFITCVLE